MSKHWTGPMVVKQPVDPQRVRTLPEQFGTSIGGWSISNTSVA